MSAILFVGLVFLSVAELVAGTLPAAWTKAHFLLRAAEELHRTFKIERNVQVMRSNVMDDALCGRTVQTSQVSRKQYEDSWMWSEASGSLDAVFNGTCFTRSAASCVSYRQCPDASQAYPLGRDASGNLQFAPPSRAQQGLWWAANKAKVASWHEEQADLQEQLLSVPDDSSIPAQYLRRSILEATANSDASLRVGSTSLLQIGQSRIADFFSSVSPASAPSPLPGSPALPPSLTNLASAAKNAADAAARPCTVAADWQGLLQNIQDQLSNQANVLSGFNASALLTQTIFDYTWRAVEAIVVGVSAGLQAGVLAAFTQLLCAMQATPRTATVPTLAPLQDVAGSLLQQLSSVLPNPADDTARSAPLQRCFADRVRAAGNSLAAAAEAASTPLQLLSLDFCRRLFEAVGYETVALSPYTGAVLAVASGDFSGDVVSQIVADEARTVVAVQPFASYELRGVTNRATFAAGDKVIVLRPLQSWVLNRRFQDAESSCTFDDLLYWNTVYPPPSCPACLTSCKLKGCRLRETDGCCVPAPFGTYTLDGVNYLPCPNFVDNQWPWAFYPAVGWPNSSCPLICGRADQYPVNGRCQNVAPGWFAPPCRDTVLPCLGVNSSIPAGVVQSMVYWTSSGGGVATGCESTLGFTLVLAQRMSRLLPPFTVQLWVKMSVANMPPTSDTLTGLAVLVGVFPHWYIALRRSGTSTVRIGFYHARITRSVSSRQDSVLYSENVPWDSGWHHAAVAVTSADATFPNVFFYVDGRLVSSAQRSTLRVDDPQVHPAQNNVLHVGPPNAMFSPTILVEGATEPYSPTPSLFAAEVDEIRVSSVALDVLSQGFYITELRRRASCGMPFELLDGTTCMARPRLTASFAAADQLSCKPGFEECGSRPGSCVAVCAGGTLRQPDCTCDCPFGKFQVWLVKAVYVTGSGTIGNVTVYDAMQRVVGQQGAGRLPIRVAFPATVQASVITVGAGGTATIVGLDVETADGMRFAVPGLSETPLQANGLTILHHRRPDDLFDSTLWCAACPGKVLGSQLPRLNVMACLCAEGYGRNKLGSCVPIGGPLPQPAVSPTPGTYPPGIRVRLALPAVEVESPELLAIRYALGTDSAMPTCQTGATYVELSDGSVPGLDIIRRRETVRLCTVLCHPLFQDSLAWCGSYVGNDVMNPPWCTAAGNLSSGTTNTYALQVQVTISLDLPDATIYYQQPGMATTIYTGPTMFAGPGTLQLQAWAEKAGFDRSTVTTCAFSIDGPSRLRVRIVWPEDEGGSRQLAGFLNSEKAFLVVRGTEAVRFRYVASVPEGSSPMGPVQLQYRLARGSEVAGQWVTVPASGSVALAAAGLLQPPSTNTILRIEWRAKENGFVWSDPWAVQLALVATKAQPPRVSAVPSQPWGLTDSWAPGPKRNAALRQVHQVNIQPSTVTARLLFVLGSWAPSAYLLDTNLDNATSMRTGALVQRFQTVSPSADLGPDEMPARCGVATNAAGLPILCEYLGPFQVLAGTSITAFAIEMAMVESQGIIFTVPRESEPDRGDVAFKAGVLVMGNALLVQSLPNLAVLPSAVPTLTFSLEQPSSERQYCVLISVFSYTWVENMKTNATVSQVKLWQDCKWTLFNGIVRLQLQDLALGVAQPSKASVPSINITIVTTMRLPGYLWAFPTATALLWLNEQTPSPNVVAVKSPGDAESPAAMVWLQDDEATKDAAGAANNAWSLKVYFTLRSAAVQDSDLTDNYLAAVPDRTSTVRAIRDAFQPTPRRSEALQVEAWLGQERLCAWPALCELPLDGTLPRELVRGPADLPWVCTWALWYGYTESPVACKKVSVTAEVLQVKAAFFPDNNVSTAEQTALGYLPLQQVGSDLSSGAIIVLPTLVTGRRLYSAQAPGLPLYIPRSYPLQYRSAVLTGDPVELEAVATTIASRGVFSDWTHLGLLDPPPLLQLPTAIMPWEHLIFTVELRLLTGINRWSLQSRSSCIVLLGQHPAVSFTALNRTLRIQSPRNGSVILFRWSPNTFAEPRAKDGGNVVRLQAGIRSVGEAYALEPGIRRQLRPSSTPSSDCVPGSTPAEQTLEASVGPRLCSLSNPSAVLAPPDGRRWVLWAAAYSPGLSLSDSMTATVFAQCSAPVVSAAASPACLEGMVLDSGMVCTPRCLGGYRALESSLRCVDGVLSPSSFSCLELPCSAPGGDIAHAVAPRCQEGAQIASGGVCTPQCQAGYIATRSLLTCSLGVLSPSNYSCTEAPCSAPEGILYADDLSSCSGLRRIQSGSTCIAQCKPGYVPSQANLTCVLGTLIPPAFQCLEAGCSSPSGVRYAAEPPCTEGRSLSSGGVCTPSCLKGYVPSEVELRCLRGTLQPSTFACTEILVPGSNISIGTVSAAAVGGVAAMIGAAIAACCCCRRQKGTRDALLELPALPDPLQEWWQCLQEVDSSLCVFCGIYEPSMVWTDIQHGPPTTTKSCGRCAKLLTNDATAAKAPETEEWPEAEAYTLAEEAQGTSKQHVPLGAFEAPQYPGRRETIEPRWEHEDSSPIVKANSVAAEEQAAHSSVSGSSVGGHKRMTKGSVTKARTSSSRSRKNSEKQPQQSLHEEDAPQHMQTKGDAKARGGDEQRTPGSRETQPPSRRTRGTPSQGA